VIAFKCKICAGSMTVDRITGIGICDYCGTKQVLPQFSDDSSKRLFDSGNNYLQHSEYDKAENVFNQLLSINPQDAEIYWSLVLCKYGVSFVKDPQTGKYVPTCNRTHYESILKDGNYLNAIKYSNEEKSSFYKEQAEVINKIQKGIIEISRKEKPFDIFISYKETDSNGKRTEDSIIAQDLYEKLTQLGYKVFFSRITLEDKVGTEYEPYIYAALYSSNIMLTISSSKENIEAPWVKNEWSRYLSLRQKDPNKTLLPLYFNMNSSELPEEFDILSAQDMRKNDFEQELIRGIKKMIPLPVIMAEKREKRRKRIGIVLAIAMPILMSIGYFIYPEIISYFENKKIHEQNNEIYNQGMDCYNAGEYMQAVEIFSGISGYENADEMKIESENMVAYTNAMQLYYDGDYSGATWAFKELGDYKDSGELQEQAELAWRKKLATVVVDNKRFDNGEYFISPNGDVKCFSDATGNANNNLETDNHGKIISIASNNALYALCEDGYVINSKRNNGLSEDWANIVQITDRFNSTNVALTSDGTVIYGDVSGKDSYNLNKNDEWLSDVENWEDIVSLSFDIEEYVHAGETYASLLGIKKDGTVCAVFWCDGSEKTFEEEEKFVINLVGIKYISVSVSIEGITIAAIDNNDLIHAFINGETYVFENKDARIVQAFDMWESDGETEDIFFVDNKYKCRDVVSDNVLISDVVLLDSKYIITKTGNVYSDYSKNTPVKRNVQTQVYDVWME